MSNPNQSVLNILGDFTWLWNSEFFIETAEGNYVWSDPDYAGDNTLRPVKQTLTEYLRERRIDYGRDKGKHFIGAYCGQDVKVLS